MGVGTDALVVASVPDCSDSGTSVIGEKYDVIVR
jgi:hypothetical protein